MYGIKKAILLFFMILGCFFYCNEEEKDHIKISIKCGPGNFGESDYKYNGGDTITFVGADLGNNSFEFEKTFGDLESIEINTKKTDPNQLLEIKIYRDKKRIKYWDIQPNEFQAGSTTVHQMSLSETYNFGDEEEDTDDGGTTK